MEIKKLGALLVSAALCAGMAAPAFAFEGEASPVEQPVLPEVVEDVVTITDETSGALTPEGNLTLVDDYHTSYSDGSGQQSYRAAAPCRISAITASGESGCSSPRLMALSSRMTSAEGV